MSDLDTLVALRRAQLADLRQMHKDGHPGAAAGIDRVEAELKVLAKPPADAPASTEPTAPAREPRAKSVAKSKRRR